ncbi:MAG: hypothetical protein LW629_10400 [Burkholderiales bacterium]|nr:hypothetical protein [Burkholderiales bacterium]
MKKVILAGAISMLVSGAVLADAKSFEGYNAGLNASSVKTKLEFAALGQSEQTDGWTRPCISVPGVLVI